MTDPNITGNGTIPNNDLDIPIIRHILALVLSLLAVVLNGFLILVMTKYRKSFFHTRVSYFVFNLAIADCLTGVSLAYLELYEMLKPLPLQHIVVVINWTTIQSSFYTLFLMSVDRLVIVLYSLNWSSILTIRRTVISIKFIWLVSITGGVMMHFYQKETQLAVLIFVELCTLMFVCNSLLIYPVLRKREKGRFESDTPEPSTESSFRPEPHDKMSTVVVILMVVLIVTQLPFFICLQLWLMHSLVDNNFLKNIDTDTYVQAYMYTQVFACLNFVVNPIVYAWRIRTYRKAFVRTLKWWDH